MLFFVALNALLVGLVHNSFIPQGTTDFMTSSSQKAESFQESCSNTMESYTNTNGISDGLQEFESSMSQSAQSFQEASSSTMESINTNGIDGGLQEFESSMSQTAQSFQEASSSTMESINTNGIDGGLQEFESSMSQTAQSFQEASSSTMESINTNGIADGLQEYASSQTRSASSSAYSSSSSNYERSTSLQSSAFDYDLYLSAFEKSKFISEIERQCYLRWLETFSSNSLDYYNNILEYLNIQKALSSEILDYKVLQKEIISAHETFTSNGVYEADVDLSSKTAIFEESKSKIKNALNSLSQESALYKLLTYSIDSDMNTLPVTIGLFNGIVKNQETYFSETSVSTSSTNEVRSVGSTTSSTKSSTVNVAKYESILSSANIQTAESKVYLSHLSKLTSDKMYLFTDTIGLLNKNTQVLTNEMILDFASLNQELESIYNLLVQEQFFVEGADWLAKKDILTQMKTKLSKALRYVSQDSIIYQTLEYCLKQDISLMPLFIGLNRHVFQQQSSYFSSTTTTVSSSSSKGNCVM